MSKIVDLGISTSYFEKTISDYSVGVFFFSEEDCCLNEKHFSGDLTLKNNKVIRLSASLKDSVHVEAGDDICKLFACPGAAAMQVKKLSIYPSVECLILDAQHVPYWARLTLKGNKLQIEDIDMEKRFELDSEDQIEELERLESTKGTLFPSVSLQ